MRSASTELTVTLSAPFVTEATTVTTNVTLFDSWGGSVVLVIGQIAIHPASQQRLLEEAQRYQGAAVLASNDLVAYSEVRLCPSLVPRPAAPLLSQWIPIRHPDNGSVPQGPPPLFCFALPDFRFLSVGPSLVASVIVLFATVVWLCMLIIVFVLCTAYVGVCLVWRLAWSVTVGTLCTAKQPCIYGMEHFALPKSPVYMAWNTLHCQKALYIWAWNTLHCQKALYIWAWEHFALPKMPLHMDMGTLCNAKKCPYIWAWEQFATPKNAPTYGHGNSLHCQKGPYIWVWQHFVFAAPDLLFLFLSACLIPRL